MNINISGVDLDWYRENGRIPTFDAGSLNFFSATIDPNAPPVLLPDCEEAYAILGYLTLAGIPLKAKVLTSRDSYPTDYTTVYFIKLPGYELLILGDKCNQGYLLQFVNEHEKVDLSYRSLPR